jgi:hypothetical protein
MNPELWGPPAWYFMHRVTVHYPVKPTQKERDDVKKFFNDIPNILPCNTCSDEYKNCIKSSPLTVGILSTRNNLIKWLVDIHNKTNQKINQKQISFYEFKREANEEIGKLDQPDKMNKLKTTIWFFFHFIILKYPDTPNLHDKRKIKDFFSHVPNVLPHGKLRGEYEERLKTYPLDKTTVNSKKNMLVWYRNMKK